MPKFAKLFDLSEDLQLLVIIVEDDGDTDKDTGLPIYKISLITDFEQLRFEAKMGFKDEADQVKAFEEMDHNRALEWHEKMKNVYNDMITELNEEDESEK